MKELAPRKTAVFHCERLCPHTPLTRSYAADIEPPFAVECRCGKVARREGAPPDSQPETPRYGYTVGGAGKAADAQGQGTDPMSQLRKRRSKKDGARILAEAETEARARRTGAAS